MKGGCRRFRIVVLAAALSGAAAGSIRRLKHHPALSHKSPQSAAFLALANGVSGQQPPSLAQPIDDLAGVLDSAVALWGGVRDVLETLSTECRTQVGILRQSVAASEAEVANLQTTRQHSLGVKAGEQAQLDHLSEQEEEAQASFESTIAQRAEEAHEFHVMGETSIEQQATIQEVLGMLREKRTQLTTGKEMIAGTTPKMVDMGKTYAFVPTTDYNYSEECLPNRKVQVFDFDNLADPPVHVRWEHGYEHWVRIEDLRNITVVPGTSSGPSGGFETIIGVFESMLHTATDRHSADIKEHSEKDAHLLKLVTSYKETLQHVDAEYERVNAARTGAQASVTDSEQEITLRTSIDKEYSALVGSFLAVSGDPKDASGSGKVKGAQDLGNTLLSTLRTQVEQALVTMNVAESVTGSTDSGGNVDSGGGNLLPSFLQTGVASRLGRGHVVGVSPSGPSSSPALPQALPAQRPAAAAVARTAQPVARARSVVPSGRAARWLADARAHGVQPLRRTGNNVRPQPVRHLVDHNKNGGSAPRRATKAPAQAQASIRRPLQPAQVRALVAALPAAERAQGLQILNAMAKVGAGQGGGIGSAVAGKELPQEHQECVDKKRQLTTDIVAARRSARDARTTKVLDEHRLKSLERRASFVDARQSEISSQKTAINHAFEPLMNMWTSSSYDADLTDALTRFSNVEAEVDAYMAWGPPPQADGLPLALSNVKQTLMSLKEKVLQDIRDLLVANTNLLGIVDSLIVRLDKEGSTLKTATTATQSSLEAATASVTAEEQKEQDLFQERMAVEDRCERVLAGERAM